MSIDYASTSERRGGVTGLGGSFCAAAAFGTPFHVDFVGPGMLDQGGAVVGMLIVFGLAALWLFRSHRAVTAERPTVAPGVAAAMWSDLEACEEHDADVVDEPVASQLVALD